MNNLILQGTFGDKSYPKISSPKKKRCHHSFISDSSPAEASYHHKKVWLHQYFLSPRISKACKFLFDDSNKCHFLWSLMLKKRNWLENPKLSRIQILIDSNVQVLVILTASTHIQLRLRCQPLIRYERLLTLGEKCPYSEFFWHVFSPIRTECKEILRISQQSVQMPENTDQKNSEYGHFLGSVNYQKIITKREASGIKLVKP